MCFAGSVILLILCVFSFSDVCVCVCVCVCAYLYSIFWAMHSGPMASAEKSEAGQHVSIEIVCVRACVRACLCLCECVLTAFVPLKPCLALE